MPLVKKPCRVPSLWSLVQFSTNHGHIISIYKKELKLSIREHCWRGVRVLRPQGCCETLSSGYDRAVRIKDPKTVPVTRQNEANRLFSAYEGAVHLAVLLSSHWQGAGTGREMWALMSWPCSSDWLSTYEHLGRRVLNYNGLFLKRWHEVPWGGSCGRSSFHRVLRKSGHGQDTFNMWIEFLKNKQ